MLQEDLKVNSVGYDQAVMTYNSVPLYPYVWDP